jgi:hypothetical protein
MTPSSRPGQSGIKGTDLGIILLLALIAAAPLWGPGLVNTRAGGDSPFLLQRTLDMAENLRHGALPARWMAHGAYDLGIPFFNHYAALPYYISGGLTALGIPPLIAIQGTQTLGLVLSGLTMALWAHRIHKTRYGVIVSVTAYLFAPFHLVNLYVRGDSLSEFYAFIIYPLILWAIDRLADREVPGSNRFPSILIAGLAYGALILTHNVSLLIFSPFAFLYALLRLRPRHLTLRAGTRAILLTLSPFILGMTLTAWFWIPALVEVQYGQLGAAFTEGYFHYSRHFRGLNLIQPRLAFEYAVPGRTEEAGAFATGLIQAALALLGCGLGLLWTIKGRDQDPGANPHPITLGYPVFGFLLATLMITPLSKPLWSHLPLLETTQFPWRFLSIQAVFTAILAGFLIPPIDRGSTRTEHQRIVRGALTVLACAAIVLSAMVNLHPDRLRIEEDITWDTLLLYETFTGNIGTTIRYEYLPKNVVPRLYISESVIDGLGTVRVDGEGTVEAIQLSRTPVSRRWHVDLGTEQAGVVFPINAWPGWRASVGDKRIPVNPLEGSGRLSLALPAGDHDVEIRLGPTPLRAWSMALSILMWLATIITLTVTERASTSPTIDLRLLGQRPSIVVILVVGTALSIGLPAVFHGDVSLQMQVFDFEAMPYPHDGPVDFGPTALTAVDPIPETLEAGSALIVPLRFDVDTGTEISGMLRLVSPAEPRHGVPYRLAETPFILGCGEESKGRIIAKTESSCEISIRPQLTAPDDLSRGLTLIQLTLEDQHGELRGRTPQGRTMGPLYLGAIKVRQGPSLADNAPVLGQFDELTLHEVDLTQPDPTNVHLTMRWSTAGTPRNWSLSVRLLDVEGRLIAQHDQQPGYGYLPTSLWRAGEQVTDQAFLHIPEGLAPGRYTLRIITYLQATMAGGGEHDVPITLSQPTLYDLRDACCEQTRKGRTILCQAEGVALISAKRPPTITQGDNLALRAEWNALEQPTADIKARWSLIAADGKSAAEVEGPLSPGSEPSQWPRHTWVETPVTLPLPPQIEPGEYTLQLSLIDEDQNLTTCTIPQGLSIEERPRVFEAPDLASPRQARFGDQIQLLGYEHVLNADETLRLTLWWKALAEPVKDYKRFVHLYDAQTHTMIAQDDAMPRAWTYPTSWWAAGEVVSETVTLDIDGAPPGTYPLAVGWYDPETMDRLPALDASGTRQPDDRLILNTMTLRR